MYIQSSIYSVHLSISTYMYMYSLSGCHNITTNTSLYSATRCFTIYTVHCTCTFKDRLKASIKHA